jgi:anti-anti-sigma regulatory factor
MIEQILEPSTPQQSMLAPSRLTAEERLDFRRTVLEALELSVRAGAKSVDVDLSATVEVDASGLGVLILLQKRARERGLAVRLLHAPNVLTQMLESTRLAPLFETVRD